MPAVEGHVVDGMTGILLGPGVPVVSHHDRNGDAYHFDPQILSFILTVSKDARNPWTNSPFPIACLMQMVSLSWPTSGGGGDGTMTMDVGMRDIMQLIGAATAGQPTPTTEVRDGDARPMTPPSSYAVNASPTMQLPASVPRPPYLPAKRETARQSLLSACSKEVLDALDRAVLLCDVDMRCSILEAGEAMAAEMKLGTMDQHAKSMRVSLAVLLHHAPLQARKLSLTLKDRMDAFWKDVIGESDTLAMYDVGISQQLVQFVSRLCIAVQCSFLCQPSYIVTQAGDRPPASSVLAVEWNGAGAGAAAGAIHVTGTGHATSENEAGGASPMSTSDDDDEAESAFMQRLRTLSRRVTEATAATIAATTAPISTITDVAPQQHVLGTPLVTWASATDAMLLADGRIGVQAGVQADRVARGPDTQVLTTLPAPERNNVVVHAEHAATPRIVVVVPEPRIARGTLPRLQIPPLPLLARQESFMPSPYNSPPGAALPYLQPTIAAQPRPRPILRRLPPPPPIRIPATEGSTYQAFPAAAGAQGLGSVDTSQELFSQLPSPSPSLAFATTPAANPPPAPPTTATLTARQSMRLAALRMRPRSPSRRRDGSMS